MEVIPIAIESASDYKAHNTGLASFLGGPDMREFHQNALTSAAYLEPVLDFRWTHLFRQVKRSSAYGKTADPTHCSR